MVLYSLIEIAIILSTVQSRHQVSVRDTSAAVIGEAGFTIRDPQRFANHFGRFILEENERFNNQHQHQHLVSPTSPQSFNTGPAQRPPLNSLLLQLALQARNGPNPPIRFPAPESDQLEGRVRLSEKLVVTTSAPRSIFSRPTSGNSREALLRKLNTFASSSSIISTPFPSLQPNLAGQSGAIQNPLLQTLFQNKNLQGQTAPRVDLQREREIALLLDQRNEKERLLIEALRKQSRQRQGVVILPSTSTTSTTTTTTTTATTTPTTPPIYTTTRNVIEDFRSSAFVEDNEQEEEEEFKVEIILEMTRELVEATHKQRENLTEERKEFSGEIIGKSFEEKPERPTALEAIMSARNAVLRTMRAGNDRTSPAIWAAVKILSDFVDSQQPGIPPDVLLAIVQLTDFLNAEDNRQTEEPGPVVTPVDRFIPTTTTTTTEKQTVLSPTQIKLREKLLIQKIMKQQQINKIIQRAKQNKRPTTPTTTSTSTTRSHDGGGGQFPNRISLMDVSLNGQQFSFSTLPIY